MSRRVYFRPAAREDLLAIYRYIAGHSSGTVAAAYVGRVRAACQKLEFMPNRGQPRNDLGHGIRTLAFEGRATIAYRVDDVGVRIIRVFAAGLDYSSEDLDESN